MNSREHVLALFSKQEPDFPPLFSGLISVCAKGLEKEGLRFHEVHHDPKKMARAAASTYRLSGFGSAVLPLDMCVEAEALGATIDYRDKSASAEYPRVAEFLYDSVKVFTAEHAERTTNEFNQNHVTLRERSLRLKSLSTTAVENQGRIPLVCKALGLLKADVGAEIVIGGYLPGPFTLLSLLVETGALYHSLRKSPEGVHSALQILTQVLASVGNAYHTAGADFLTIHEMGGSPGALGPKLFESIVLPQLKVLTTALPRPVVLSVCGRTTGAMRLLAASGADALSVDQTNDLPASRKEVPQALLFGNLDPVGLLSQGSPGQIAEAVTGMVHSGADAVWPGCDLDLHVPLENLQALVKAAETPNVL